MNRFITSLIAAFLIATTSFLTNKGYAFADNDLYVTPVVETLNVRSGPGTNYTIVGVLSRGESARFLGTVDIDWTKIDYRGYEAYVFSAYVTNVVPDNTPPPQANDSITPIVDDLNVRSGPGTNYPPIGVLRLGQSLRNLGVEGFGWTKVEYQGNTAYVFSDYVTRPGSNPQPVPPPRPTPPPPPTPQPDNGGARPVSAYDCPATHPIKGNANSGIYHMPFHEFYSRTKPEACFSNEAAAVAAGYRRAYR
jgi:uncharacterized protein YraI